MTHKKIGVGMPTGGLCEARTAFSILSAVLSTSGIEILPLLSIGCYIHHNRDRIVNLALENNCTHLWFCDSDMMFPPDTLNKLMSHEVDIVGARYNKRVDGQISTVPGDFTGLTAVPFVPTGCLLINCEVFKKIGKPYFSFDDGAESEDVYFCQKSQAAGYETFCDPSIVMGHLGTAIF